MPGWFCYVGSKATCCVELCYHFIGTITCHVTADNNRITFMVRPRLQHILYDINEALVPFDPLHSFHRDTYSIEAVRHERSSLICFLTAKISVLVSSLLLLFVSRWLRRRLSFWDMSDSDFQASIFISGTMTGSLSRDVKRSHSPLLLFPRLELRISNSSLLNRTLTQCIRND